MLLFFPSLSLHFPPHQARNVFLFQILLIGAVVYLGYVVNDGRKFVRVMKEGCKRAWVDITTERIGDISHPDHVACCSYPLNETRWDAGEQ